MHLRQLFKRSSTGATLVWWREVEGDSYRTHSGQKFGAMTASAWTVCKPKNVGRSNETSAEKQAFLECESAYTKKLAQGGYHENEADINTKTFFEPMLAKSYKDRPEPKWGNQLVFSQPKLDGVRCIAKADGLWTRQGKAITACPHISEQLAEFFEENPEAVLDGELYADKLSDDFNKIISLVKKVKPDPARVAEAADVIEYHVYDDASHTGSFRERWVWFREAVGSRNLKSIKVVETTEVKSLYVLDELYGQYMDDGYEGQMVRLDGPYKHGRSADLLKRKEFIDEEFEVVDILEGDGNRAGMAGRIVYRLKDGRTFKSGIKGDWTFATKLLKEREKYIEGEGTVRYFNLTPDGIPRFPITVALYPDGRDL